MCDFSIPQNFVGSYTYALPVGHNRAFLKNLPSYADAILGGWVVSGITTLQSGLPFTPTISGDQANTGVTGQRPNAISSPVNVGTVSCWFYVAANPGRQAADPGGSATFSVPALYNYGTSGRNILRADNLVQFDFTVTKQSNSPKRDRCNSAPSSSTSSTRRPSSRPERPSIRAQAAQIASTLNAGRTIELALKLFF